MHNYSATLKGNFSRIKKNGTVALRFSVTINGDPFYYPTDQYWPAQLTNNDRGVINPASKNDRDLRKYNEVVDELDTIERKIKDVFKAARDSGRPLTKERFHQELSRGDYRRDFCSFMRIEIQERYDKDVTSYQTKKNENTSLRFLTKFQKTVSFQEINKDFLERYAAWLKKTYKNNHNTVWGKVKHICTYLSIADADHKIAVNENYKRYNNKQGPERLIFFEEDELAALANRFDAGQLTGIERNTLAAALFSCFTGLRIGDLVRVCHDMLIDQNTLRFTPQKNLRRSTKIITVPIPDFAKQYIQNKRGLFFNLPTQQEMRRTLKDHCRAVGIEKDISFHTCRHTFGTLFYRKTKDLVLLQKILGHSQLKDTMKYVHINEHHAFQSCEVFNQQMDKALNPQAGMSYEETLEIISKEQAALHRRIRHFQLDCEEAGFEISQDRLYLELLKRGLDGVEISKLFEGVA